MLACSTCSRNKRTGSTIDWNVLGFARSAAAPQLYSLRPGPPPPARNVHKPNRNNPQLAAPSAHAR